MGRRRRYRAVCLVAIMVLGAAAPALFTGVAGASTGADAPAAASTPETPDSQFDQQAATATATNESEKREAAKSGVERGVTMAQMQGVEVNQTQVQAVNETALRVANQTQDVNVSQIQSATAGATHAALVQSQNVTVEQVQAAVAGATNGSLTQSQNATATQLQSATFGAVHGTLAQKQNVTVEQIQNVTAGAAAGAAKSAAKHEVEAVPAVQEAAQGSAYGAITQTQNVTVEQRQAAAFGAAYGVIESNQTVSITQRQSVDVKKVQATAIAAARGGLTQSQEATVEQVQSACRGAAKGAISQSQRVTVTQLQAAAEGAAKGGISQHQVANVTQIQAASSGGASGALTQTQSVNVVQIQQAASGGASGAAKGAAQSQVVNVRQIQAAAAGAAQGGVVQIQIVNVIQIQIITGAAAEGAVSQHQEANVVQIQKAAEGASRGGVSQSQTQEVSVEQIQTVVLEASSTAAQTAAEQQQTEGEEISKSAQNDVEEEVAPTPEDIESLVVSVDCESITVENPNDRPVTVTRVGEDGGVAEVTVGAGETESFDVVPQSYALRAETDDGTSVPLDDLLTHVVVVDQCPTEEPADEPDDEEPVELQSLNVTVEAQSLTIVNSNEVTVTVTVENVTGVVFAEAVAAGESVTVSDLAPGEYDVSAERDGETVQVEGEDESTVTIPEVEEPFEPESLNVTVDAQNLTVQNPNDETVTVTVENDTGGVFTDDVAAGENVTVSDLAPGDYDVSAEFEGQTVPVEGEDVYTVTINETDAGPDTELSECTVIDEPGEYNLTSDVEADVADGACLDVQSNDVTIDGQGYAITRVGSAAQSVAVGGSDLVNVTVTNLTVRDFETGISFETLDDGAVRNVTVGGASASDSQDGVSLDLSSDVVVANSTFSDEAPEETEGAAVSASQSQNVTVSGNDLTDATIVLTANERSAILNNSVSVTDAVTSQTSGVYVSVSSEILVENNSVDGAFTGLAFSDVTGSTVADNRISDADGSALFLAAGVTNRIRNNSVVGAAVGIETTGSADTVVENGSLADVETAVDHTGVPDDQYTVRLVNVTVTDATTAARATDGGRIVAEEIDVGQVTNVSWNVTDVAVAGPLGVTGQVPGEGDLPALPDGVTPITSDGSAPYLGLTGTSEDANASLTVTYDDAALPADANESDIRMWQNNGTATEDWSPVANSSVDTQANVVTAVVQPETGTETVYGPAEGDVAVDLESLNVTVEGQNVTVENPNDVPVNVSVANETGVVANASVPANDEVTLGPFAAGEYEVTATFDGQTVPVEGEDSYTVTIEAVELDSLDVETDVCAEPVDDPTETRELSVNVTNPNDQDVAFVAYFEGEFSAVTTLAPGENTVDLDPDAGNWTFEAYVPADEAEATDFDQPDATESLTQVPVDGESSANVTVELCPIDLSVTATDGTLTVTNDAVIDATVELENETTQTETVPAGGSVTFDSLAAGEYTLTAAAIDGGPATLNGQAELTVVVEAAAESTPAPTDTPTEPTSTPTQTEAPTPTPTDTPAPTPTDTPTETTPTETGTTPTDETGSLAVWDAAVDGYDALSNRLASGSLGTAISGVADALGSVLQTTLVVVGEVVETLVGERSVVKM